MLPDRYTSNVRLELLQRVEPLAHVEPGVHLRHDDEWRTRGRKQGN